MADKKAGKAVFRVRNSQMPQRIRAGRDHRRRTTSGRPTLVAAPPVAKDAVRDGVPRKGALEHASGRLHGV